MLALLVFIALARASFVSSGDGSNGLKRENVDIDASWRQQLHLRESAADGWPYPYAVNKTNVRCCNNTACLDALGGGGLWCKSGLVCIATYCYVIPNYPCATQVETCDERNRKCLSHTCKANSDCDDGVFCNGEEQCVRGVCIPGSASQCHGGICDEVNKKCSYPNIFSQWLVFSKAVQSSPAGVSNVGLDGSVITLKHHNSTTGEGFPDQWTIWVIVCVAVLVFIVVAFMLIAMVSKGPAVIGPIDGGAFYY